MDKLYKHLSKSVAPATGAVRKVHSAKNGRKIASLDEFEEGTYTHEAPRSPNVLTPLL